MGIKDCSMVPPTTDIDAPPFLYVMPALPGCCVCGETLCISVLSVCLFVLHPLYFCPNLCTYVCLYVSVYVCVSVYV